MVLSCLIFGFNEKGEPNAANLTLLQARALRVAHTYRRQARLHESTMPVQGEGVVYHAKSRRQQKG